MINHYAIHHFDGHSLVFQKPLQLYGNLKIIWTERISNEDMALKK